MKKETLLIGIATAVGLGFVFTKKVILAAGAGLFLETGSQCAIEVMAEVVLSSDFKYLRQESDMTIWPGDFFSTRGKGLTGWLNRRWTKSPSGNHTDRFHYGVIADPVLDSQQNLIDFETRESISKGPSTIRFFKRYLGQDIELYRLPHITPDEGLRLVRSISQIGERPYGYRDFLEAGWDVLSLLITLQFPPYTAQQLRSSQNKDYICTEIPAYGANNIARPVEPPNSPDIWVIPTVYLQAVEEGRLIRYYKGKLHNLFAQSYGRPYAE